MSQDTLDDTATAVEAHPDQPTEPTQTDTLAALQQANDALTARIDELLEAQADRATLADRLARAEAESDTLRNRCQDLALRHALDEAAVELGISPQAAAMFQSRFTCSLDDAGRATVEPDPAAVLKGELESNPLLRESVDRREADFRAAAVATGAAEVADVDPVELMTSLDRVPVRKARFISRHGPEAFLDLAAAARRNGYRG